MRTNWLDILLYLGNIFYWLRQAKLTLVNLIINPAYYF